MSTTEKKLLKQLIQKVLIKRGLLEKGEFDTVWDEPERKAWIKFCGATPGFGRFAVVNPSYETITPEAIKILMMIAEEPSKTSSKKKKKKETKPVALGVTKLTAEEPIVDEEPAPVKIEYVAPPKPQKIVVNIPEQLEDKPVVIGDVVTGEVVEEIPEVKEEPIQEEKIEQIEETPVIEEKIEPVVEVQEEPIQEETPVKEQEELKIVPIEQEVYDNLEEKDPETLYLITKLPKKEKEKKVKKPTKKEPKKEKKSEKKEKKKAGKLSLIKKFFS